MSAREHQDHAHMVRALLLAERGLATTDPNPRVGCVLAHGGEVVGEGWHERAGEPHAEIHALRAAGERARGATVYVTLEPCSHQGRTGPCADALIAAGVARVVAACDDPNPKVSGQGYNKLRAAGIAVERGLLREPARELNRGFLSRMERGRPWVRLKLAATLDGRTALADGSSQWITGAAARADGHRWRARSSALLTGIGTVLADDPRLTVRLPEGPTTRAPLRVVLDTHLRIPPGAAVLDDSAPTLVFCSPDAVASGRALAPERLMSCPQHVTGLGLAVVLAELAQRECNEVQVEAGPTLSGAFVHAGLADEVLMYLAPSWLGDTAKPLLQLPPLDALDQRERWRIADHALLGEDLRLVLRPKPAL